MSTKQTKRSSVELVPLVYLPSHTLALGFSVGTQIRFNTDPDLLHHMAIICMLIIIQLCLIFSQDTKTDSPLF